MTDVRAEVSPGADASVTGTVIDAGPAYPGADVNWSVSSSTIGLVPSDRVADTPSGSAIRAVRPGRHLDLLAERDRRGCSPDATRSSGAFGRGIGRKNPSAGTVMNA